MTTQKSMAGGNKKMTIIKSQRLVRLKKEIFSKGYRVYAFADAVGIHSKTLSMILGGSLIPTENLQNRIAEKLGKSRKYLFTLDQN
jgi:transcriptional regulator with XRE-family HTH domain